MAYCSLADSIKRCLQIRSLDRDIEYLCLSCFNCCMCRQPRSERALMHVYALYGSSNVFSNVLPNDVITVDVLTSQSSYLSININKLIKESMDAKAFWENYSTAQTWQQMHNVVWWKSRCVALEAENETLREMIEKLVKTMQCQCQNAQQINNIFLSACSNQLPEQSPRKIYSQYDNINIQKEENLENYQNYNEEYYKDENHLDDENLEFHVNEGMMDFLKQSIKHKMELKQQREENEALEREGNIFPQVRAISLQERIENAKLLYGESSPRILGMETALQATIDSHKDKIRPNYWPNIPLKL